MAKHVVENSRSQFNLVLQQRIRQLRKLYNWTQKALARRLGMTEGAYQQMERRGGSAISAWIVHELKDMTGVDLMDFRQPVQMKQPVALDLDDIPARKTPRKTKRSTAA